MAVPQIPVVATYCAPVMPNSQMHRRDLAVASEAAIAAVLHQTAPRIPLEI
jgi:hypothetical protein